MAYSKKERENYNKRREHVGSDFVKKHMGDMKRGATGGEVQSPHSKAKALKKRTEYHLHDREGRVMVSDKNDFKGYDMNRKSKDGKPMFSVRKKSFNVRTK